MGSNLPNPTAEQAAALDTLVSAIHDEYTGCGSIISLTGPAGTGKTTVMKQLTGFFSDVEVVTPTNRAAGILRKKGVPAATCYAIFFTCDEVPDPNTRRKRLVFKPNHEVSSVPEGKRDFANVIIVDEASMLGTWVIKHLQRMCNWLILVGDGAQLPPVSDRQNPRGLFCTRQHDATLKTIMRQEGDSPILALATAVRTAQNATRLPVDMTRFEPDLDFSGLMLAEQPQLISFRNATRISANLRARRVLGIGETPLPVAGDLMVCNTNFSDRLLNGTQCWIEAFNWNGQSRMAKVTVRLEEGPPVSIDTFDMLHFMRDLPSGISAPYLEDMRGQGSDEEGVSFSYGYCMTAHKAQGGEWPCVVVLDERSTAFWVAEKDYEGHPDQLEPNDFCRRWFYTAVTRAQKHLYVVNPRWVNS